MKIKHMFILLAASVSTASCGFLDEYDPNATTVGNFYKSEADIVTSLNGVYASLTQSYYYTNNHYFTDVRSHDTAVTDSGANSGIPYQFYNYTLTEENSYVYNRYTQLFKTISRANTLLAHLDDVSYSNGDARNTYEAEIRFLRALTYFHLVTEWGDVPLVFRNFRAVCQKSEFVESVKGANCRPALLDHFLRGGRHKRRKQTCANHDGFGEVVKHGCQSVFLAFVLCKHPRHSFVDILVCSSEHGEYIRKRVCRAICVDICKHLVSCRFCKRFKLVVNGFAYALVANDAAEILVAHGDCSLHEVAVHVDKLAVDGIDNQIPADYAVVVERHLRKQIISYAVNAEKVHEIVGINDVAFGL